MKNKRKIQTRREFLRTVAVGGALSWSAPALFAKGMGPAPSSPSPQPGKTDFDWPWERELALKQAAKDTFFAAMLPEQTGVTRET